MNNLDFAIDQAINALDRQIKAAKVLDSLTEKDDWQKPYWITATEFWADSVKYWSNQALQARKESKL
jgi:hypothetical protein